MEPPQPRSLLSTPGANPLRGLLPAPPTPHSTGNRHVSGGGSIKPRALLDAMPPPSVRLLVPSPQMPLVDSRRPAHPVAPVSSQPGAPERQSLLDFPGSEHPRKRATTESYSQQPAKRRPLLSGYPMAGGSGEPQPVAVSATPSKRQPLIYDYGSIATSRGVSGKAYASQQPKDQAVNSSTSSYEEQPSPKPLRSLLATPCGTGSSHGERSLPQGKRPPLLSVAATPGLADVSRQEYYGTNTPQHSAALSHQVAHPLASTSEAAPSAKPLKSLLPTPGGSDHPHHKKAPTQSRGPLLVTIKQDMLSPTRLAEQQHSAASLVQHSATPSYDYSPAQRMTPSWSHTAPTNAGEDAGQSSSNRRLAPLLPEPGAQKIKPLLSAPLDPGFTSSAAHASPSSVANLQAQGGLSSYPGLEAWVPVSVQPQDPYAYSLATTAQPQVATTSHYWTSAAPLPTAQSSVQHHQPNTCHVALLQPAVSAMSSYSHDSQALAPFVAVPSTQISDSSNPRPLMMAPTQPAAYGTSPATYPAAAVRSAEARLPLLSMPSGNSTSHVAYDSYSAWGGAAYTTPSLVGNSAGGVTSNNYPTFLPVNTAVPTPVDLSPLPDNSKSMLWTSSGWRFGVRNSSQAADRMVDEVELMQNQSYRAALEKLDAVSYG